MHKPQRLVYGEELVELGRENDRIVVLDVDCSSSTQSKHFGAAFPDRLQGRRPIGDADGHITEKRVERVV